MCRHYRILEVKPIPSHIIVKHVTSEVDKRQVYEFLYRHTESNFQRSWIHVKQCEVVAAYDDSKVVGCGLMLLDGPNKDHYYGHAGLIHPDYRNKGIYHRLLKKRISIKGDVPMFVRPVSIEFD